MVIPINLLVAALVATANAVPNAPPLVTSVYSTRDHITKYKPTVRVPTSLPTKTRTLAKIVSSTITTCSSASTSTTTVTPDAVTVTVSDDSLNTLPVGNVGAGCTTTTTLSASVATVYTGQYNATVAKRTAGLFDHSPRGPPPGLLGQVFHRLGQNALINQKAFEVDCFEQLTTYVLTTKTVAEEPAIETVTAETPTVYVTRQGSDKGPLATTPVVIRLTATAPPAADVTGGTCTVTANPSSTTTQHLKCAPTNLISEVNGYGIGQTQGDETNERGLAPGSDPSACCQLCIDTEDCAASEDDPDAGNCFLWYTQPTCGLGFKYSDNNQKLAPGSGFIVQDGCGYIEATEAPGGQ